MRFEIMRIVALVLGCVLLAAMLVLIVRAVYTAFIKRKDERSKWIVTKSMAQAFLTISIIQFMQFIVAIINYEFYQKFWNAFTSIIYTEPFSFSLLVLGIFLLINQKKHGGS